jgi:hypothetical protein
MHTAPGQPYVDVHKGPDDGPGAVGGSCYDVDPGAGVDSERYPGITG